MCQNDKYDIYMYKVLSIWIINVISNIWSEHRGVCCHCTNISWTYRTFVTLQAFSSSVPYVCPVFVTGVEGGGGPDFWNRQAWPPYKPVFSYLAECKKENLHKKDITQSASLIFDLSIWKYKISYTRPKCYIFLSAMLKKQLLSCAMIERG
jgi:hypothetical protein